MAGETGSAAPWDGRVSRKLSGRRHISATAQSVLLDRYGQGGPRPATPGHRCPEGQQGPRGLSPEELTMKRFAASLVAAAALLGSTLAGTALGQDTNEQGAFRAPKTFDAQQGWNDQSNQGRYRGQNSGQDRNGSTWGSNRGRFDSSALQGRWVADNRAADFRSNRGDFRGHGPMRGILLPDFIRIDQKPSMVRIADSRNNALQLIMLGG